MQRRKFLTSAVGAAVVSVPLQSLNAEPQAIERVEKPFVVKAGEARFDQHMPFRGINPNDLKVSSKDTNGGMAIFEYVGKEKIGPHLHLHLHQDEVFHIVEGEYFFQVGEDTMTVKAGDTVFGPRNVPHTWIQRSDTGKMVYLVQPAGTLEAFFAEMNQLKGPPTKEEIQRIHQKHGMTVLGPPLAMK